MRFGILLALFFFVALSPLKAGNVERIIRDTQKMSSRAGDMNLVWWIPTEFWDESLKDSKNVTDSQRRQIHKVLDDYSIFVVVAAKIGPFGGLTPSGRDEILKGVEFKVGTNVFTPLSKSALSEDAVNFIDMMKPMMAGMLGQFGKSMEFVVYNNKKGGKKIIDGKANGGFDYKLFDQTFHWKLPIGSLLPDKVDAETGETFPGDFIFNPYSGKKLQVKGRDT